MTPPLTTPAPREERYPLPLFVFLAGLILLTITLSLRDTPRLQHPLTATGILAVTLLHLALHWHSPRLGDRERPWTQYMLAQGGLAILLTFITGNPSVWAAAFTWLVGETVGMLNRPRLTAISLSVYGLFGVAALFAITDPATAGEWLGAILPTMIFVGVVVVLYKRQVEAREEAHRLVAELEEANRQIAAYAEQVETLTLANERQRMARALHDTLAQDVAGLVLQLEAVNAHLGAGRVERARAIVHQSLERSRAALKDTRAAIDDLREHDARARLSERLAGLIQRFQEEMGIRSGLTVEAGHWDAALPAAQKEELERLLSEALANVRKHAAASHVGVHLRASEHTLTLRVEDDGIGFQPEQASPPGHYGLRGMRERARLLGGDLRIDSAPGAGTTVLLEMPLPRVEHERSTP
jgi:two-component system, NarL family, sensor histidine kinase YdfH